MWYYITAAISAAIGFAACALLAINGENKEIKRLRKAMDKIVATRFSSSRYEGAVIAEQALKGS